MSHLISDFYSMEGNSESNSVKCNSNSNDDNSNSIPIPPGLGQANSISIPELDLELARNSNSGAELAPALASIIANEVFGQCIPNQLQYSFNTNSLRTK